MEWSNNKKHIFHFRVFALSQTVRSQPDKQKTHTTEKKETRYKQVSFEPNPANMYRVSTSLEHQKICGGKKNKTSTHQHLQRFNIFKAFSSWYRSSHFAPTQIPALWSKVVHRRYPRSFPGCVFGGGPGPGRCCCCGSTSTLARRRVKVKLGTPQKKCGEPWEKSDQFFFFSGVVFFLVGFLFQKKMVDFWFQDLYHHSKNVYCIHVYI